MKTFWIEFVMAEDEYRAMVRENAGGWTLLFHRAMIVNCIVCFTVFTWLSFVFFKGTWHTPEFNEFQIVRIISYALLAGCFIFALQAIGAVGTLVKALRFKTEEYV